MADGFNKGDLVRLRSGGPIMTVDLIGPRYSTNAEDEAQCSWFETVRGRQVRNQDWFALTSLVKVNEREGESAFYPGSSIMG